MAQYWVADLHLGQDKVSLMRGFKDCLDHDLYIADQLIALKPEDRVWVLGDISSGRAGDEEYALGTLSLVKAELHLIAGNHDTVSSIHRNGFKMQKRFLEVFDSVQQFGRVKFNKENILMSHYPYARSGDGPGRGEGRYNEFRLPDMGLPLIHGHTHHTEPHMSRTVYAGDMTSEYVYWPTKEVTDFRQLCVSWDAHRRLVTEKDILNWRERDNERNTDV